MSEPAATLPTLVTCHVCSCEVPDGEFCGVCGAHLVADSPRAAQRPHAFAANPHEHLLHLSAISTLFPHLPHRRSAPFRVALLLVTVAIVLLSYLRLTGPSIAVATLAVPLLYLIYLYEVEVYEDDPVYVIGVTFVLGVILGVLWAHFTGDIVTQTAVLATSPQGAPLGRILVSAVLFPLIAQALMLVGAVIIYLTRHFDEALDGFTFGAAGAMGFILATTLVDLLPELQSGVTSVAPAIDYAAQILQRGLLIPFIVASTTGIIGSALWLNRGRTRRLAVHGWTTTIWAAVALAIVVQIGLGFVNVYVVNEVRATLIYLLVAVVLLLCVRIAIHHGLLAEAVESEIGPDAPCFHCRRMVPRMAFCPHCGVATRSAPKSGVGRADRVFR
jgi:hypothetical protein